MARSLLSEKRSFDDFQTSIIVSIIGVTLFFLFFQILDRIHNCIRNEGYDEQDIELGNVTEHQSLANSDWSHEAAMQDNIWLLQVMNGVMAFLADRQGLSPEDLEKCLPLVDYKSIGQRQTSDECVICLEDFEEDELCRVFPVYYPLILSFVTAIGIFIVSLSCLIGVCIIAASFIILIIYIICECLSLTMIEKFLFDLLKKWIPPVRLLAYQAIIPNYLQQLEIVEDIPQSIEERARLRQQALEKLLPRTIYGGGRHPLRSKECAICLEDYVVGEPCRVFPVCKHMFHLTCIDHWLKNHLTCPVCRKSI
ncbi:Zinc finger, RING-type [Corchorus olitorius]|uniref:Zinc finger, RING-type n=1 Tax=Corchorus olitorius TaxID=93759 RepID=A0A1R3KCC6_9ROSI|nr:Zinc finger, RING-type [Corchorus olitorius]